jgi:hypothetical protein
VLTRIHAPLNGLQNRVYPFLLTPRAAIVKSNR